MSGFQFGGQLGSAQVGAQGDDGLGLRSGQHVVAGLHDFRRFDQGEIKVAGDAQMALGNAFDTGLRQVFDDALLNIGRVGGV